MASSNSGHASAILAVQEKERALDSVSQKLDVFRVELDTVSARSTNDSNAQ
jgi:hypothetical protein